MQCIDYYPLSLSLVYLKLVRVECRDHFEVVLMLLELTRGSYSPFQLIEQQLYGQSLLLAYMQSLAHNSNIFIPVDNYNHDN